MLTALTKKTIFTNLFCVMVYACIAQPADTSGYAMAINNAVISYHQFLNPETGLYNGREYYDYSPTIKDGDPFFLSTRFNTGNIIYDGILYQNVPILYDLVTSDVIITDSNYFYRIKLNGERVGRFSVLQHTFIRLEEDSNGVIKTGFYDLLYDGQTRFYKKHIKRLQESVTNEGVRRYIVEAMDYYVLKGNVYYQANSKNDLLSVLKDKKKELNAFIKKNKLDTRKKKDESFAAIVAYYDQLNKSN